MGDSSMNDPSCYVQLIVTPSAPSMVGNMVMMSAITIARKITPTDTCLVRIPRNSTEATISMATYGAIVTSVSYVPQMAWMIAAGSGMGLLQLAGRDPERAEDRAQVDQAEGDDHSDDQVGHERALPGNQRHGQAGRDREHDDE